MKKLKILFFVLIGFHLQAQNHLGISKKIYGFLDTVSINQSVSYHVFIKNYGPSVFTGQFNVNTWVDSTNIGNIFHFSRMDTILQPVTINAGDSLLFHLGDTYDLSTYRTTGNTIVIWPKTYQAGWSTADSAFHSVYVRPGPLAINELNAAENDFALWPNPANEELNITFNELKWKIEDVRVLNNIGQCVLKMSFQEKININELPPGMYLLELSAKEEKVYKRFIKTEK